MLHWPLWWWALTWLAVLAAGVAWLWWRNRPRGPCTPNDTGFPDTWPPLR